MKPHNFLIYLKSSAQWPLNSFISLCKNKRITIDIKQADLRFKEQLISLPNKQKLEKEKNIK